MVAISTVNLDYDHIQPLLTGLVQPDGIELSIDRSTNMRQALQDPTFQLLEMSFSVHLQRLARGDRSWVGIPLFVRRAFCHRAWFVPAESPIEDFAALQGSRIGIHEWPTSGNSWARWAAREGGLDADSVSWVVAPLTPGPVSEGHADLPANVTVADEGETLMTLLDKGEISAFVTQFMPPGLLDPEPVVRRLFRDYPAVELASFQRTGIFPGHHIMGMRAEYFEQHPEIALSLYRAYEDSKTDWFAVRLKHGDTAPWALAACEEAVRTMGWDWQPNGLEVGRILAAGLCDQLAYDGLIPPGFDPDTVFTEFATASQAVAATDEQDAS